MSSTPNIGQGSDHVIEPECSDGVNGLQIAAIDEDEELIKETRKKVNTKGIRPKVWVG